MILARYVLGEVLKTFLAALLVFSMIFIVGSLYEFVREDLSARQILFVLPYVLVYTLPFLLPVALLVGCALGYGRLAADNEILPIVAGGIPISRLALPAVGLGLALSGLLYGLQGTLIPYGFLKKKDLVRGFIEQLTNLGVGENKLIQGNDFYLLARRHAGEKVFGVEFLYMPEIGGGSRMGFGGGLEQDRPTEIVARDGRIYQDELRDAIVLALRDVHVTQYVVEGSHVTMTADGLPPRGIPHHGSFAEVEVEMRIERKVRDKTEFRSSDFLRRHLDRIERYLAFVGSGAPEAAAVPPAVALAAAGGIPGAGPGAAGLALTTFAASSRGQNRHDFAVLLRHKIKGYLTARLGLSLAPFAFALIGAALPLTLQSNNRLIPFFASFAIVSATFFLPFLTAQQNVEKDVNAPVELLWIGPALTVVVGAVLIWRLRKA